MACKSSAVLVPVDVSRRVLLLLSSLLSALPMGFGGPTGCGRDQLRAHRVAIASRCGKQLPGAMAARDREPGNAGRRRRLSAASAVCWWP